MNDALVHLSIEDAREFQSLRRAVSVVGVRAVLDAARRVSREAVLLATCERLEVLSVGVGASALSDAVLGVLRPALTGPLVEHGRDADIFRVRRGPSAERHVLRVAAGLESRIVGETHVLGQLRQAEQDARAAGALGPVIGRLMSVALRAGARVRSETALGRADASCAAQALRLVSPGDRVGVVGSGVLARECVRRLLDAGGPRPLVLLRQPDRLGELLGEVRTAPIAGLRAHLEGLDVVISCVSAPDPVIRPADIEGLSRRPALIDLGSPRNIDPAVRDIPGVRLTTLEDVSGDAGPASAALAQAAQIVDDAHDALGRWWRGRSTSALARASGPGPAWNGVGE